MFASGREMAGEWTKSDKRKGKKSNKTKPPIAEVIDMLADNNQTVKNTPPASIPEAPEPTLLHQPLYAPTQPPSASIPETSASTLLHQPLYAPTQPPSASIPEALASTLLHQPLYVPTQPPFPHQPPYSSAVDSS
jgi:hypothetical protein